MATRFPSDFGNSLGVAGFGGDFDKNQAQHRALLQRTPVVLVHGNGGNATHQTWGMQTLREFLAGAGYQACEIWALSYLGDENSSADLNDPHRHHIHEFRTFVDEVREYLGVAKLDFIAHSLGCGMVNAYLRGLRPDGTWDNAQHRLDRTGTFVSLAGATYGLGPFSLSEFKTGSPFELASHRFNGVEDDSPRGSSDPGAQEAPVGGWLEATPLDDNSVRYVALTASDDFVDMQLKDTGRRQGADLNERIPLGSGIWGHEKIIKSSTVFNLFKPFLNKHPPAPPVVLSVDQPSGNFGSGLRVTVSVEPASSSVAFRAERLKRSVQAGFLVPTVEETLTGTLAHQGTLVLATDGAWEVSFSAEGSEAVRRYYGVNVVVPEVEILTDNSLPFSGPLLVQGSTNAGTLHHSTDGQHWLLGASLHLDRTATVSFIAIDSNGISSDVQARAYVKAVPWTDRQTATLTQHFIALRLSVNAYVALGLELGFNATVTLYQVGGEWVRNPEAPAPELRALPAARALATRALEVRPLLGASLASGNVAQAVETVIAVTRREDAELLVHYTTDGSDPSDEANPSRASFTGSKAFRFEGNGHHCVLCYARHAAGGRVFESFVWAIDNRQYPQTSISPARGGLYAGPVGVALQVSQPCRWTRYTTDGTEPSETAGTPYSPGETIAIDTSTVLKYRSQDLAGRIEPTRSATFTIVPVETTAVFASDAQRDGTVMANASGKFPSVGAFADLVVGSDPSDSESRAILHFDTSSLPDNAIVTSARLELELVSLSGDSWDSGAALKIDVKTGCFGSSRALQARDWSAKANAEAAAQLTRFTPGVQQSTEFSEAGRKAIHRSGATQVRLRLDRMPGTAPRSVRLEGGPSARLIVEYATEAPKDKLPVRKPAPRARAAGH